MKITKSKKPNLNLENSFIYLKSEASTNTNHNQTNLNYTTTTKPSNQANTLLSSNINDTLTSFSSLQNKKENNEIYKKGLIKKKEIPQKFSINSEGGEVYIDTKEGKENDLVSFGIIGKKIMSNRSNTPTNQIIKGSKNLYINPVLKANPNQSQVKSKPQPQPISKPNKLNQQSKPDKLNKSFVDLSPGKKLNSSFSYEKNQEKEKISEKRLETEASSSSKMNNIKNKLQVSAKLSMKQEKQERKLINRTKSITENDFLQEINESPSKMKSISSTKHIFDQNTSRKGLLNDKLEKLKKTLLLVKETKEETILPIETQSKPRIIKNKMETKGNVIFNGNYPYSVRQNYDYNDNLKFTQPVKKTYLKIENKPHIHISQRTMQCSNRSKSLDSRDEKNDDTPSFENSKLNVSSSEVTDVPYKRATTKSSVKNGKFTDSENSQKFKYGGSNINNHSQCSVDYDGSKKKYKRDRARMFSFGLGLDNFEG